MLFNVIYSVFLGLTDLLIFYLFTQSVTISWKVLLAYGLVFMLFMILHSGRFSLTFLMSEKDFFDLMMFSIGLAILNIMGRVQNRYFDERIQDKMSSIYIAFRKTIDFIQNKLIYVMIYIYQLVAIWFIEIR